MIGFWLKLPSPAFLHQAYKKVPITVRMFLLTDFRVGSDILVSGSDALCPQNPYIHSEKSSIELLANFHNVSPPILACTSLGPMRFS